MSQTLPPSPPWFWSGVFCFKGVWNCLVSVLFFFGDDPLRDWLGTPRPDPAYRAMFLALAFTFGLGYWRIGRDLTSDHDIVRGGVLGQSAVFSVLAYEVFVARRLPMLFLGPEVVDLLFAVLFVVFLFRTRAGTIRPPAVR